MLKLLQFDLGIKKAIGSSPKRDTCTLVREIRDECFRGMPKKIYVDYELFSELFKTDILSNIRI